MRTALDRFLAGCDAEALVRGDPVELVRAYEDPHDQEVAGLVVAALAYGRVASIKAKARVALSRIDPSPAAAADGDRVEALSGFVHRFQRGEDLPRFVRAIGAVRRRHGSLAACFASHAGGAGADYGAAIDGFVMELRDAAGAPLTYGLRFLLPRAEDAGGAAKRVCLYLRWMIRPAGAADLGSWQRLAPGRLDPAKLIIPLDTHIERIGRYIGLTDRRTSGMRTAREITCTLRELRPADPLAYDLALCHLGVSGRCPRKRDVVRCAGCPIKGVCRLGAEPRGWRA